MPIKYIGKKIDHKGKRLYEILYKLKDFGVGRMVHRNYFSERYPEACYYIIMKVNPDPINPMESFDSRATARKIWRGIDLGENIIKGCYKHDWRLVPKHEEEAFKRTHIPPPTSKVLPDTMDFAPLHEYLILEDIKRQGKTIMGKPQLPRVISKLVTNRALLQSEVEGLENDENLHSKKVVTGHSEKML